MKFWDSSAIVPLLVSEGKTQRMRALQRDDASFAVWWGSAVECASALARRERESGVEDGRFSESFRRLGLLQRAWQEIQPTDAVRDLAMRLLRVHTLQAADAVQLAAAIVAAENRPATLDFVCLDARLGEAAQKEGFRVVGG